MLPQAFTDRMKQMLQDEYSDFVKSYEETKNQALRLNSLKGDGGRFLELCPFHLSPVAWNKDGYYYNEEDKPGKHPYHEAGVYYIQEASAMAPVTYMEVEPGEKILDLCASPGGKTTQIAGAMKGQGILVCNEIHPARAKILSENVERMGVKNAIVVSHAPDELAEHFPGYFDRILVDAPCSGEGMFRKNEEACTEWSLENVEMCAKRQDTILESAAQMLKAGGRLVYSTCTFAPQENEGTISRFLQRYPEFSILPVKKAEGMAEGNPVWTESPAKGIEHTIRLWPHKLRGEGHYLAVLEKAGRTEHRDRGSRFGYEKGLLAKEYQDYLAFEREYLNIEIKGTFIKFGEQLYVLPENAPALKGLKVLRPGLHLGTLKKNRFEPSHALALAMRKSDVKQSVDMRADDRQMRDYLNGQTFPVTDKSGWCLITADDYAVGWGKAAGGMMKNHYPKGLRKSW